MKLITREVTVYTYTFAHVNLQAGKITDMESIDYVEQLSQKEVKDKADELGKQFMKKEERKVKCSLPLELFVSACAEYAAEDDNTFTPSEAETLDRGAEVVD